MIYGAILAGGSGVRVKSSDLPKQFIEINGLPIVIHTLNSILKVRRFDYIYIAARKDYVDFLKNQVKKNISEPERVIIIAGGKERLDSIKNITFAIERDNEVNEEDIIVIHDAVRPLVTLKILEDSINGAVKYGACVCGLPCADTILHSDDGEIVYNVPIRDELFCGQSPDSFNLAHFIHMLQTLTAEQNRIITGTSQICTLNNQPIHIIEGDSLNFKITTDSDLIIAKSLLEKGNL